MLRVGVLASGGGSNFEALVSDLRTPPLLATVVSLTCNVESAPVIERAHRLGVKCHVLSHRHAASREAFDTQLVDFLRTDNVNLVVLAGYMRLVSPVLLEAFPRAVINIHPSLLPDFKGLHAVRQALAAKVTTSGCTVHFVDAGMDTGQTIAQASVAVAPSDTEDSLASKIHQLEHQLLPRVVRTLAAERGVHADLQVSRT
jgi:phosphoribosylglycinamide formyltransferase 1